MCCYYINKLLHRPAVPHATSCFVHSNGPSNPTTASRKSESYLDCTKVTNMSSAKKKNTFPDRQASLLPSPPRVSLGGISLPCLEKCFKLLTMSFGT